MSIRQDIYCPNCGDRAKRYNSLEAKIIRTSCPHCDYLMVQCSETGKVMLLDYFPRYALNCPQAASADKPRE